jgi:hypothetical protein
MDFPQNMAILQHLNGYTGHRYPAGLPGRCLIGKNGMRKIYPASLPV